MNSPNLDHWELQTVVDYDDSYFYKFAPADSPPFARIGDGIPFHSKGGDLNWDRAFLDVLLKNHVPGPPDGLSAEGHDLTKGSMDTPEQVIGWLDYPALQMALRERQLESETWGLGTFLLLETMAFLTRQPEVKGVRIVFRAERKDA